MVSNLIKMNKIYLHEGKFKMDDIISAAFIRMLNPNVKFERVMFPEKISSPYEVNLGIGNGEYALHRKNYHPTYGSYHNLTSIVIDDLFEDLCYKYKISNIEDAYSYLDKTFLKGANLFDQHKLSNFAECEVFRDFLPDYKDLARGDTDYDNQFELAVDFATKILDNYMKYVEEYAEYRQVEDDIWVKANENAIDNVCILNNDINWRKRKTDFVSKNTKLFIIKSTRGGYHLFSKDEDILPIHQSRHLKFLHPSGFMGAADTLDEALLAAKETMRGYPLSETFY